MNTRTTWRRRLSWPWLCCAFLITLTGCAQSVAGADQAGDGVPPTLHPYFAWGSATPERLPTEDANAAAPQGTPTVFAYFVEQALPTPQPTNTRRPTTTPRPTETPLPTAAALAVAVPADVTATADSLGRFDTLSIYTDALSPGWSVADSWDVQVETAVAAPTFSGSAAIAVQPQATHGSLLFSVTADGDRAYPREEIIGVSFWLNPGDTEMATDDLSVAVLGSNAHPDWRADDASVDFGEADGFSETRLYFLDFNRTLPADEWVEVVVWLDDLIYDPMTTYVTGFYLKSGETYEGTFFVDEVTLLTAKP